MHSRRWRRSTGACCDLCRWWEIGGGSSNTQPSRTRISFGWQGSQSCSRSRRPRRQIRRQLEDAGLHRHRPVATFFAGARSSTVPPWRRAHPGWGPRTARDGSRKGRRGPAQRGGSQSCTVWRADTPRVDEGPPPTPRARTASQSCPHQMAPAGVREKRPGRFSKRALVMYSPPCSAAPPVGLADRSSKPRAGTGASVAQVPGVASGKCRPPTGADVSPTYRAFTSDPRRKGVATGVAGSARRDGGALSDPS